MSAAMFAEVKALRQRIEALEAQVKALEAAIKPVPRETLKLREKAA